MSEVISREELLFELKSKKDRPRYTGKTRHIEHQIQCAIIEHFDTFKISSAIGCSIPNDAVERRGFRVQRYKDAGMRPGFPDLMFMRPMYGFPGAVFVGLMEVKVPGGRLRPNQRALHRHLKKEGYEVVTVYSAQEGIDQLTKWGLLR